jgi:hypothetical protein
MQQRLVLRRRARRRAQRGHRLDALALARQHKPGAIVVQRTNPVGVTDDTRQGVNIGVKTGTAGLAGQMIHGRFPILGVIG